LVGDDQPGARVLLNDITQQLCSVAQEVRGLAHELFPPELALLGLVEAIRERALAYADLPVQVVAPESLPDLPAEVEAALYAITLESLTNIAKHAGASRCVIRLHIMDSTSHGEQLLELVVCDDGVGLSPGSARGVGLLSMQARAVEVGGTCQITS